MAVVLELVENKDGDVAIESLAARASCPWRFNQLGEERNLVPTKLDSNGHGVPGGGGKFRRGEGLLILLVTLVVAQLESRVFSTAQRDMAVTFLQPGIYLHQFVEGHGKVELVIFLMDVNFTTRHSHFAANTNVLASHLGVATTVEKVLPYASPLHLTVAP